MPESPGEFPGLGLTGVGMGTALGRSHLTEEACGWRGHSHHQPGLGADGHCVLCPQHDDITGHLSLITVSLKKNNSLALISSSDLIDLHHCHGHFEISTGEDQMY